MLQCGLMYVEGMWDWHASAYTPSSITLPCTRDINCTTHSVRVTDLAFTSPSWCDKCVLSTDKDVLRISFFVFFLLYDRLQWIIYYYSMLVVNCTTTWIQADLFGVWNTSRNALLLPLPACAIVASMDTKVRCTSHWAALSFTRETKQKKTNKLVM